MALRFGILFFSLVLGACGGAPQDEAAAGGPFWEKPPTSDSAYENYSALPWEAQNPQGRDWSNYLYFVLDKEAPALISAAQDVSFFCPNYPGASRAEKLQFWGHLFAQIAKYESAFNPTMRTAERGKIDAVTGRPLYSEGLLQMSYQDIQMMPECEFDWSVDRYLAVDDPRKSVFNPYKNLRCGVLILNQHVSDHGKIVLGNGAYWAVIKSNSDYQKLGPISTATRALSFCKSPDFY